MKSIICSAIRNQQLLSFTYKGNEKIVEPHLLGIKKGSDKDTLSAWRVKSTDFSETSNWCNYSLENITNLKALNETFSGKRDGYNPNDETMSHFYCRL